MLPLVKLEGTPREQGVAHGRSLRGRIAKNRELYFTRFRNEVGLPRAKVLVFAAKWERLMATLCPQFLEGIRGIAEGADSPLLDIVALNVRYEILYYRSMQMLLNDGCTAFVALPEASRNGRLLHGQNWDWIPGMQGAMVHVSEPGRPEYLGFTEAGIFGAKIGFNSAGIALTVNGMSTTKDDWERPTVPFHARCREILLSADLMEADRAVTGTPRACSANFLISWSRGEAVDLEVSPDSVNRLKPVDGLITHANHFSDPANLGVEEPTSEYHASSVIRQARLRELLAKRTPLDTSKVKVALADHLGRPRSICRHQDRREKVADRSETKLSVIMDPAKGRMDVAGGRPCSQPFRRFSLQRA